MLYLIFSLLKRPKSDIFKDELVNKLERSAINQVSNILDVLPDPGLIGIENWLDTFFIKTKVANISGPSQTFLDNTCRAFMPFIQPSVLGKGFNLEFSEKKNGKAFLHIITSGKKLNKYPLVKDQIIYPFTSNLLFTRIYQKLKRQMGLIYKDDIQSELLFRLKDFVLDKINSQDVKNFDLYDYDKISNLAANYYGGNKSLTNSLTWWITFDIWKEIYNTK